MIEDIYADARIVGANEKCVAGSEACSDNSKILVALLLQPIETGPRIYHGLPGGVYGPTDV